MYCDSGLGTTLGWGAGRAQGVQAAGWALGAQAGRRRWALGARGLGAGGVAWALGARAGLELCTRCIRPVFGPVRLGIFLSQIFWTLFVNPVHEHCSARIFSKKKYFLKIFKNQIKFDKIFEK